MGLLAESHGRHICLSTVKVLGALYSEYIYIRNFVVYCYPHIQYVIVPKPRLCCHIEFYWTELFKSDQVVEIDQK